MDGVAIVGDIHGDADRLTWMLERPEVADRKLVFLGDYINRGPASQRVVDILLELRDNRQPPPTFLMGNHDEAFLAVLRGGPVAPLLLMGGGATVRSWAPDVVGDVGEALRSAVTSAQFGFFAELEREWANDEVLATHETHARYSDEPNLGLLVVGHYIQRDFAPEIVDGCAYLDTGCGSVAGAPLSALLLPERRFLVSE